MSLSADKIKLVVLGSTRGTSLELIIESISQGLLNAEICEVISNKEHAYILERAAKHGIENSYISAKGLTRAEYDSILISEISIHNPDLVLLIGYMRILSDEFVNAFRGKVLNIHPSLLPKHAGLMDLDVHQSVIDAKDDKSGCTIHEVSEELDGGAIILQKECDVSNNDTAETLKQKVQKLEGSAWVEVIRDWDK